MGIQQRCSAIQTRKIHMARLRDSIRSNNIYWWVDSFLQAGISKSLGDFPEVAAMKYERG